MIKVYTSYSDEQLKNFVEKYNSMVVKATSHKTKSLWHRAPFHGREFNRFCWGKSQWDSSKNCYEF
jgi:hypothetical protein